MSSNFRKWWKQRKPFEYFVTKKSASEKSYYHSSHVAAIPMDRGFESARALLQNPYLSVKEEYLGFSSPPDSQKRCLKKSAVLQDGNSRITMKNIVLV